MKTILTISILFNSWVNIHAQDTIRILNPEAVNTIWIETSYYLKYNSDTLRFLDKASGEKKVNISEIIDLKALKVLEPIKSSTPEHPMHVNLLTYLTDNRLVYMAHEVFGGPVIELLDSADNASFIVLNEHWTKDNSRVFYNGEFVADAHPPTFRIFKPEELSLSFWGMDKFNFFEGPHIMTKDDFKSYGGKIKK